LLKVSAKSTTSSTASSVTSQRSRWLFLPIADICAVKSCQAHRSSVGFAENPGICLLTHAATEITSRSFNIYGVVEAIGA